MAILSKSSLASSQSSISTGGADSDDASIKEDKIDLSKPPSFTLQDLRNAIPSHCFERNVFRSFGFLALDLLIVAVLAATAYYVSSWLLWPVYWLAQGSMFWSLFVIGHDCGHQSFSNYRILNNLVGNIIHSFIMVPYHGWRISHRTHHANHGHVENDESWYPVTKSIYDKLDYSVRLARLTFPSALFAYPFYLWLRSPGKSGSHYNPESDLFAPAEKNMVLTSDAFLIGMLGVLAACTWNLGFLAMFNLYFVPYVIGVVWLDVVTYLHHHGPQDPSEKLPWYRDPDWTYLRGGLTTVDRDYGMFSSLHHNIGTHVVHHLFPLIPHYHLKEATKAVIPVMGPYYRQPAKSPGLLPTHLIEPLIRSFRDDQYVDDEGSIVYYKSTLKAA